MKTLFTASGTQLVKKTNQLGELKKFQKTVNQQLKPTLKLKTLIEKKIAKLQTKKPKTTETHVTA